ncbi:MAG: flavodoxin domain-containing protein [Candidatus Dormibacteraeota bacterium]|nr:flavodoxin domain-containing protein [Candidatus Dormibacteraeota bacterium]
MSVLVAYASRYGATQGIAERIAQTLAENGQPAEAQQVDAISNLARYDAFVIGSAIYMFHWRNEAVRFVRRNRATLTGRPVWLFSSGPLGSETADAAGRDVRTTAGPKEIDELMAATKARAHRVFFGAFNKSKLRGVNRAMASAPGLRKLFLEGDFRDWPEIDAWAVSIARVLAPPTEADKVAGRSIAPAVAALQPSRTR